MKGFDFALKSHVIFAGGAQTMSSCVSEGTTFPATAEEAQGKSRHSGKRGKSRNVEASKRMRSTSLGLQAAAQALSFLQSSEALLSGLGLLEKQRLFPRLSARSTIIAWKSHSCFLSWQISAITSDALSLSCRDAGSREAVTSTRLVEILGPAQESGESLPLADKVEVVLRLTDVVLEILATDAEVVPSLIAVPFSLLVSYCRPLMGKLLMSRYFFIIEDSISMRQSHCYVQDC